MPAALSALTFSFPPLLSIAIGAMTGLLGPIMIVFLGGVIGFVVMAILLPIFETSTMVR